MSEGWADGRQHSLALVQAKPVSAWPFEKNHWGTDQQEWLKTESLVDLRTKIKTVTAGKEHTISALPPKEKRCFSFNPVGRKFGARVWNSHVFLPSSEGIAITISSHPRTHGSTAMQKKALCWWKLKQVRSEYCTRMSGIGTKTVCNQFKSW